MKYKLYRLKRKVIALFIGSDKKRLDKAIKDADLHNELVTYKGGIEEGFESMEHFMERLKHTANQIEWAYYLPTQHNYKELINHPTALPKPHDKMANDYIDEAIRILKAAKEFNKLFGF